MDTIDMVLEDLSETSTTLAENEVRAINGVNLDGIDFIDYLDELDWEISAGWEKIEMNQGKWIKIKKDL